MKIAIVTSHPVPFALGGAENLWWGLQNHIQAETAHSCDIVALVTPEDTLDGLVASYKAFSELDLSAYDCVISGKYPAWMVRHPNHVCYMLHRLRGLYDTYSGLSADSIASGRVRAMVRWLHETAEDPAAHEQALPEFFERYRALRETDAPEECFAFPGPLAREIVHFLDGIGLSPARIQRYAAISGTVVGRGGYFPPGAEVSVLHPPPHRDDYRCGAQDHLFTSSRLDRPKRLDLVIAAMAHVEADIPLLIAGAGPDEQRLRELARNDPRIRFLGFTADEAMPALYADALAVPFVPYDEDYGLVTIEAMRSGKPVLTLSDAGGPTEFVRDGETGFVTAPDAAAIGARIQHLADHRDEARQMGERAREAVAGVTWSAVFDGLMERPVRAAMVARGMKPKITVATTFPVYPPMGGGQARVFNLYKHMADTYDIDIVSLDDKAAVPREIASGMVEIRIAKSARQLFHEQQIAATVAGQPVGDIASALAIGATPDYLEALRHSCATSALGIACHPYLVGPLRRSLGTKPLYYEAQDVEFDLKRSMLAGEAGSERLLDVVREVEGEAWRMASRVFACTREDIDRLRVLYGPTRARLHEVPNGVALDEVHFTDSDRRREVQKRAGLEGRLVALFMGSWHQPNIEAVEDILAAAEALPAIRFVVVGSVGWPFRDRVLPANVDLLGQVDATVRNDLLASAHVALNPMRSGSGTNLKMLDYFAAGIPVISSMVGARGLAVEAGRHFIPSRDGLAAALKLLARTDATVVDAMVKSARLVVEEFYSWQSVAARFLAELDDDGAAERAMRAGRGR